MTAVQEINKLNTELEENIGLLKSIYNTYVDNLLNQHIKENAIYGIGDFLRAKKINFFIKVERIDAKFYDYDGGNICIYYYGKAYKKVDGYLIRTKSTEEECLTEDAICIIVDDDNKVIL